MKISIIGTGVVGQTIAEKLVQLGHYVYMGTRDIQKTLNREKIEPRNQLSFNQWIESFEHIKLLKFSALPEDSDFFLNATSGKISLEALGSVGTEKMNGKILIDLANSLDFSNGMPPSLSICNTDSLGETIQRSFPKTKVVKTFNTMNCTIMVDPSLVSGDHSIFVSGNDVAAKLKVADLLQEIGWKKQSIVDLGDIKTARGTEMMLPLWITLRTNIGSPNFNFHIVAN